nr:MAG TPA: hypothetical protein [Caudoviricetes sp.]
MTTKDELTKMTNNIRYLDRDVRLACMQGVVGSVLVVDLDDEVAHKCNVAETIGLVADLLGFYDEAREKGLLPQKQ